MFEEANQTLNIYLNFGAKIFVVVILYIKQHYLPRVKLFSLDTNKKIAELDC